MTGESVSKQRRMGIKYDLQVARDLKWQGADYMEVSYYNGCWMPVGEAAELCCQEFHSQDDAYWAVDNKGCSNHKEQYGDVIQLLLQWLYASGLAAGFNIWEWNMCMKHLGDLAVHRGVRTLMEMFERAAPPGDFDMSEWVAFMHAIVREVPQLEREYISSLSVGGTTPCINESNKVHCNNPCPAPKVTEVSGYPSRGK
jgi:hypothetical protein